MVMPQIPALFLPKRSVDDKKTSVKKTPKKQMFNEKQEQKKPAKREAALLQV
jgi:hypothetical protein